MRMKHYLRVAGAHTDEESMDRLHLCRYLSERSPLSLIAVEGLTHIVRYVNPAFCRLAKTKREDMIGKPFVLAAPESEENGCLWALDNVYRTGEAQSLEQLMHRNGNSEPSYWSYAIWAILNDDEQPAGVMIQVTDATEATLLHYQSEMVSEEVKEMNQALLISRIREQELTAAVKVSEQELHQSQKMESIGRLAGGIAHDFNNLLTAILGFTELAGEALQPDDEIQRYLHNINKAAERAATLTSQLLAFARKQIIAPKVIDLNSLILDVDKILSRLIGEHIELMIVPDPKAGKARIDTGQFGQVLINLAVNARDSMPDGGKLTIKTENVTLKEDGGQQREAPPGEYVLLAVSDTGTGISEEARAHLFEPFFTTKEQGKGTGLGLASCYGIVKQSGGHIQVESESGKGTTFTIYLPRVKEGVSPIERGKTSHLSQGTEIILLVEDEPMVLSISAKALRNQGYIVLEATNGIDALKLLQEYTGMIDLLVTDVVMPLMGGRELADRLLASRPGIRALLISGYIDDAIISQEALDSRFAFLQKPFTPAALANKVRKVLGGVHEAAPK